MRGKEIMEKLTNIEDRLIEIERKQDESKKTIEKIDFWEQNIVRTLSDITNKLEEQTEKKTEDDSFLDSMKTKDGLYSRNAMRKRKKDEEEGEI